jgi:isopentenyl diphosphate isomerase/L-lactate dehydrogenase-like FMN-dependent dehydrogenase
VLILRTFGTYFKIQNNFLPPPPTIKIDKKDVQTFVEWAIKLFFISDNFPEGSKHKDDLEDIREEIMGSLVTQGHCSAEDLKQMLEENWQREDAKRK